MARVKIARSPQDMDVQDNNPAHAGEMASSKWLFGERSQYALYAVHTRFDAVQWVVADAEISDAVTGFPSVVVQECGQNAAITKAMEMAAMRNGCPTDGDPVNAMQAHEQVAYLADRAAIDKAEGK